MRYKLLAQGPDDHSTYAECWGSTATSDGRVISEASRLADLVAVADGMGHRNWCIRDTHRRVWIQPDEFWRRPSVAAVTRANVE